MFPIDANYILNNKYNSIWYVIMIAFENRINEAKEIFLCKKGKDIILFKKVP